jgi:CBS domain-containing protein
VGAVGWDSTGGASYGIYQLATSNGSAGEFVAWLAGAAPQLAQKLTDAPGTPAFSAAWKELAQTQRNAFIEAQNAYVYANRYFYVASAIRQATGLDVLTAPLALQQALWSTTVQHGVGGASLIFRAALARQAGDPGAVLDWQAGSTAVDAGRLIHDLYYERGLTDATGSEARFRNSTLAVQHSVADRFSNERTEALQEYLGTALSSMTAGQAMTATVTTFSATDTVQTARAKLTTTAGGGVHFSADAQYAHHDFPVLDAQRKPVGMVSNRALLDPSRNAATTVGALAHRPALTVPLTATLDDVVQRMLKAGVGHVAVVDDQGCLAGVLSSSDLLKARTPP